MGPVIYSSGEKIAVRNFISRPPKRLDPEKSQRLAQLKKDLVAYNKRMLIPFLRLKNENYALFEKILLDERAVRLSFFMFFPLLEEKLDGGMENVKLTILNTKTRGAAAKIEFDGSAFMIKKVKSPLEPEVARFAGEARIGPKQYETLEGYLTEEFLSGTPFLEAKGMNNNEAALMGVRLGHMLCELHLQGIRFNGSILDGSKGDCHLLIDLMGAERLVDFGDAERVKGEELSLDLDAFAMDIIRLAGTKAQLAQTLLNSFVDSYTARAGEMCKKLVEKALKMKQMKLNLALR